MLPLATETVLVDLAQELDAESFTTAARRWQERADAVDSPDPSEASAAEPVDELRLSKTFEGRYVLSGTFSSETGPLLAAALDAGVDRALRAGREGDPSVSLVASRSGLRTGRPAAQEVRTDWSGPSTREGCRLGGVGGWLGVMSLSCLLLGVVWHDAPAVR